MWYDVVQNSDEWLQMRSGKVTGSSISKVMANYGKAFGEPAKKYAVDIAIAKITGVAISSGYTNEHMERGHEQEPIARARYEDEYFCDVTNGGFFDNGFTGDSPDGLIGDNGVVEIKSVIASVHYQRFRKEKYDAAYHWQLMFHLRETGREWVDFVSFCGEFPDNKKLYVERVYAENCQDDFNKIDLRLAEFSRLVDEAKTIIQEKRV